MKPTFQLTVYSIEQGIKNPRDGQRNWLHYESFQIPGPARAEMKRLMNGKSGTLWRLLKVETSVLMMTEPAETEA